MEGSTESGKSPFVPVPRETPRVVIEWGDGSSHECTCSGRSDESVYVVEGPPEVRVPIDVHLTQPMYSTRITGMDGGPEYLEPKEPV